MKRFMIKRVDIGRKNSTREVIPGAI